MESELAEFIWLSIRDYIHKSDQKIVAKKLIRLFEKFDCDTIEECEELVKASKQI
jgi:hypothetical protein